MWLKCLSKHTIRQTLWHPLASSGILWHFLASSGILDPLGLRLLVGLELPALQVCPTNVMLQAVPCCTVPPIEHPGSAPDALAPCASTMSRLLQPAREEPEPLPYVTSLLGCTSGVTFQNVKGSTFKGNPLSQDSAVNSQMMFTYSFTSLLDRIILPD